MGVEIERKKKSHLFKSVGDSNRKQLYPSVHKPILRVKLPHKLTINNIIVIGMLMLYNHIICLKQALYCFIYNAEKGFWG